MPPSEIDAIFAAKSKGRAKAALTPLPASSSTDPPKKNKKKKDKSAKRKRELADDDGDAQPVKRRLPETVLDPSVAPRTTAPKSINPAKPERLVAGGKVKQKRSKADKQEEDAFKDSKGVGPRKRTEEGFAVYKEDELGLTNQCGDTPLCPFDCDCCF